MLASTAVPVLEDSLKNFRGDLTVADAAARAGLPLHHAEQALRRLAASRGGHLAATESGELIYSFPRGLEKPPRAGLGRRLIRGAARVLASAGRLLVRAWVSVVLVGYAVVFVAVAVALAARDDDGDGIGAAIALIGRAVLEALFWTFHPLSPFALDAQPGWSMGVGMRRRMPPGARRLPFYERVNRFVFGPPEPAPDPRERERRLLSEIRRLEGRVGPSDVVRVVGCDREAAERELLRLVVDYDGEIEVSDGGAIIYAFKAVRTTAAAGAPPARAAMATTPVWHERAVAAPVTGNGAGTNLLLVALNGFNLVASGVAVTTGLTVDRLSAVVGQLHSEAVTGLGHAAAAPLPAPGTPLLLGWVPFLFSAALFTLPVARAFGQRRARARAAAENGRRALMRLALDEASGRSEISADEAARAWAVAAGDARRLPRSADVERAVRALGGEVDINDDGAVVYRFDGPARERVALASARKVAPSEEAAPGRVVFSSARSGTGETGE
jgi:hypothetical protein